MTTQIPNKNSPLVGCDARVSHNMGRLTGFIFRFADGSSNLIGVINGDPYTDPRTPSIDFTVTVSVNFPNGCDTMSVYNVDFSDGPRCTAVLLFIKNGVVVGNIDYNLAPITDVMKSYGITQSYTPTSPSTSSIIKQGSKVSVVVGQVISGFICTFAKDPIVNNGNVLSFSDVYGMTDTTIKPINGGWSPYSEWSLCSASCGGGTQTRSRTCTNPAPANGGAQCVGSAVESQSCNTQPCAIDGGWSPYSEWSLCSASCGGGTQTRSRTCTNPAPANGGAQCVGLANESQSCNTQPCAIDGGWSEYGSWDACDPITGKQQRSRLCNNPTPANGGASCVGDYVQQQICAVDGGWSDYTAWEECDPITGMQSKSRTCTNPAPMNGGLSCAGSDVLLQSCPVDGDWGAWGSWETCDVSTGTQKRSRECNNPIPKNGGAQCVGESKQSQPCAVDGGWSDYTAWSECDSTGMQKRSRECNNPAPMNGGLSCAGNSIDTQPCPINGGWSDYTAWEECDVSTGTQKRSRECNNPAPMNGGLSCAGNSIDTQPCAVAGGWSDYTDWGSCNPDTKIQLKTRTCTKPEPKNGGAYCVGTAYLTQVCTPAGADALPGSIASTTITTTAAGTGSTTTVTPPELVGGNVVSTATTTNSDGTTSTTSVIHDPVTGDVIAVAPVAKSDNKWLWILLLVVVVVMYLGIGRSNNSSSKTGGSANYLTTQGGDGSLNFDVNYPSALGGSSNYLTTQGGDVGMNSDVNYPTTGGNYVPDYANIDGTDLGFASIPSSVVY